MFQEGMGMVIFGHITVREGWGLAAPSLHHYMPLLSPLYTKGTGREFLGAPNLPHLCDPVWPKLAPSGSSLTVTYQLPAFFCLYIFHLKQRVGESPRAFQKITAKANNSAVECWKLFFCKRPFLIRNCNPAKTQLNLCNVHSQGEPPHLPASSASPSWQPIHLIPWATAGSLPAGASPAFPLLKKYISKRKLAIYAEHDDREGSNFSNAAGWEWDFAGFFLNFLFWGFFFIAWICIG